MIQCNKSDKMKSIFQKYANKIQKDINSIYFLYGGNNINDGELTLEQTANNLDKKNNEMKVIVNGIDSSSSNKKFERSKDIICPKCMESAQIEINDYKFSIYDYKNKHETTDILFDEFEKTQEIDITKIYCDICKNDKSNTTNNQFYRCNSCEINLCVICKLKHNKEHKIINYDQKNYICKFHDYPYSFYCETCEINFCLFCEKDHNNHDILSFGKEIKNIEKSKSQKEELRKTLDNFRNTIEEIKNILDKIVFKLEKYYIINDYIINNFNNKELNYEILHNIKIFSENKIQKELNEIMLEKDFEYKLTHISQIYKMINKIDIFHNNIDIFHNNIDINEKGNYISQKTLGLDSDALRFKFNFLGLETFIESSKDDKMDYVIDLFFKKTDYDEKQIVLIFEGQIIEKNKNLSVKDFLIKNNILNNEITILVLNKEEAPDITFIKSNAIICPKCYEFSKIKIVDYKIILYGCKNCHFTNNILFDEYENTQKIDTSKIKCEKCELTMNETYKNQFFRCITCRINLCPLCKALHDKKHKINDYAHRENNFICSIHDNQSYSLYCKTCKKNLCILCENEHNNHEIISFGKLIPNKEMLFNKIKEGKEKIEEFKKLTETNFFNKIIENFELFYEINNNIINDFNPKDLNYEILDSINKLSNDNSVIEDLNKILSSNNKFKVISDIYEKMNFKFTEELAFIYSIKKDSNQIKIFGKKFVENNKKYCKIVIEEQEYDLVEVLELKKIKNVNKTLEIKLTGISDISNMSDMFNGCESLISLSNIANMNTLNIIDISNMFNGCQSLSSLPNISKWNTSKVTNMSNMFNGCKSILSLPDISKWDTSKVMNMSGMFDGCKLISSLPDISIWKTNAVIDMSNMFKDCELLFSLPDISKWSTSKVINMSNMFNGCKSLTNLPNISNWDINQVNNKKHMFKNCNSSLNIPSKFKKKYFYFW